MKKLCALLAAALLFSGNALMAQETVGPQAKKLQHLFLSAGTGTAFTSQEASRAVGGSFRADLTAGLSSGLLFRLGVLKTGFTAAQRQAPGPLEYLSELNYSGTFFTYNKSMTGSLMMGKFNNVSKMVRVQAFAGPSVNLVTTFDFIDPEMADVVFCGTPYFNNYIRPGLLLQAEAMFLPTKFAGLTAGAYANLTPKLPSAGVSLSMNMGLLR